MDVEDYRRSYAAELQREGSHRRSAQARTPKPTGSRELQAVIKDGTQSAQARAEAIDAVSEGAVKRARLMNLLIKLLADSDEDADVREAALAALQQASFSAVDFRRYAGNFRAALRSAATDDDAELREHALDVLALNGDDYAQQLLAEGLRDPRAALVRPERALQMIGYDVHSEHYPMLRDIATQSKKRSLRRSALRLLAADSDAKELFESIAEDKSEDPDARATSAIALQSLAPERFNSVARAVVLDDDDDESVRATFVNALAHGPATPDRDLAEKVRSMDAAGAPKQLRGAARHFLHAAGENK